MAEDETQADAPDESTEQRLTAVESGIERIETMLAKVIPGSHAEAEQRTERRLDRGSAVEEQARAAVAQALEDERAEQGRKSAADAEKAEREQDRARLAALEEKPPAPPRSRRTVMLGWGDGRA